jgi:hypothetical protein
LEEIIFDGTIDEWEQISKQPQWCEDEDNIRIICLS